VDLLYLLLLLALVGATVGFLELCDRVREP
jgi:hypothetical protein